MAICFFDIIPMTCHIKWNFVRVAEQKGTLFGVKGAVIAVSVLLLVLIYMSRRNFCVAKLGGVFVCLDSE